MTRGMAWRRATLAAALAAGAAGCVPASSITPIDALAELAPGEVVLVGSVELDPPLAPGEQKLGDSYQEYADVAVLIVDETLRDASTLSFGDFGRRIDARFRKTFFVRHPNRPSYLLQGWVIMHAEIGGAAMADAAARGGDKAPLPGLFRIDVRPGDKAVYLGTVRYQRDEFFGITKVTVRDDYAKASAEFRKKFGTQVALRKALATPVKPPR